MVTVSKPDSSAMRASSKLSQNGSRCAASRKTGSDSENFIAGSVLHRSIACGPGKRGPMSERDLPALERTRAEIRDRHMQPAGSRPASSARGVHHVALLSSDVERTVRFYQDLLEFPL